MLAYTFSIFNCIINLAKLISNDSNCVITFLPHLKDITVFLILSSAFSGYAGSVNHSPMDEHNGLCFTLTLCSCSFSSKCRGKAWFSEQEEQGTDTWLKSTSFETSFHVCSPNWPQIHDGA